MTSQVPTMKILIPLITPCLAAVASAPSSAQHVGDIGVAIVDGAIATTDTAAGTPLAERVFGATFGDTGDLQHSILGFLEQQANTEPLWLLILVSKLCARVVELRQRRRRRVGALRFRSHLIH